MVKTTNEEFLDIIIKATTTLKEIIAKGKDEIEILYGNDGLGNYFIQFVVDENNDNSLDLGIIENLDSLELTYEIGSILADLFCLPLYEF